MSIYHTIADVEAKLKGMVSNTSSIITPTVFQQMCDRTEAVVTERFARKFAVPFDAIKNPNAYLIAQKICIALTANDVFQITKLSGLQPVNHDATTYINTLYGEGKSLLDQMDKNLLQMSDAVRLTDLKNTVDSSGSLTGHDMSVTGINSLPETGGFMGTSAPLGQQPVFNRRRRQW